MDTTGAGDVIHGGYLYGRFYGVAALGHDPICVGCCRNEVQEVRRTDGHP